MSQGGAASGSCVHLPSLLDLFSDHRLVALLGVERPGVAAAVSVTVPCELPLCVHVRADCEPLIGVASAYRVARGQCTFGLALNRRLILIIVEVDGLGLGGEDGEVVQSVSVEVHDCDR